MCAGGGRHDLYYITLLEDIIQNHALTEASYICWKMFLLWRLACFVVFLSFVLITTDCSLSVLVLLLSGWSSILSLTRWWCPSDNEWHDSFSGTGDLVCIPSALELCGGMCFSDPIWPMLYFVPPVWLLCHSRWVLTLFCEWFLYNHNNCHHQSLLGNFFLCHAREIKHTLYC